MQDLVEGDRSETGVRRLLRVWPEASLTVGVLRGEKRGRQWMRAHFPLGKEEDGEVDTDALDGVGPEEVAGEDEDGEVEQEDEVEREDGQPDSDPAVEGGEAGEEEEGETEDESSSDNERPPPPPP